MIKSEPIIDLATDEPTGRVDVDGAALDALIMDFAEACFLLGAAYLSLKEPDAAKKLPELLGGIEKFIEKAEKHHNDQNRPKTDS